MPFDPAAYLAKKQAAPAPNGGGFDPSAYLAKKANPHNPAENQDAAGMGWKDIADTAMHTYAAYHAGKGNGMSLGNVNLDQEDQAQHPYAATAGKLMGGASIGALLGAIPGAGTGVLGGLSRIGIGAAGGGAMGGLRKPEEGETRLGNAEQGVMLGGGLGVAGEAVSGLAGVPKYMGRVLSTMNKEQGEAYLQNPAEISRIAKLARTDPDQVQNMAFEPYKQANKNLWDKSNHLEDMIKELTNNSQGRVKLTPQEQALLSKELNRPIGNDLPLPEADALTSELQHAGEYSGGSSLNPNGHAGNPAAAAAGRMMRQKVEQVEPEIGELNLNKQAYTNANKYVGKTLNPDNPRPWANITSKANDTVANNKRVSEIADVPELKEMARDLGAAKTFHFTGEDDPAKNNLGRMLGRGIMRGSDAVQNATPMASKVGLAELMDMLSQDRTNKR